MPVKKRKGKQGKSGKQGTISYNTGKRTQASRQPSLPVGERNVPDNNRTLDAPAGAATPSGGNNRFESSHGNPSTPSAKTKAPPFLPPPNNNELILTCTEKRRGVYECDYCHNDISQLPRIRCAVCPDFDLCLDCFATTDHAAALKRIKAATATQNALQEEGVTVHTPINFTGGIGTAGVPMTGIGNAAMHHDSSHGYRVCDSTRYPLFPTSKQVSDYAKKDQDEPTDPKSEAASSKMVIDSSADEDAFVIQADADPKNFWTVEEDLRLLDGIKTHGLGNWADIADAVGGQGSSMKTPKRCMERYFDDFLGRYGQILPPYTLIPLNNNSPADKMEAAFADGKGGKREDATMDNDTTATPSTAEGTRSSKRRAAQLRSSASVVDLSSFSNQATSSMSTGDFLSSAANFRKKYKAVSTETVLQAMDPDKKILYSRPFIPHIPGVEIKVGQEVGRDQATKAELAFVKAIGACESKEQAEKIRKEWEKTRLNKPGGPTVLPMRPEDVVTLPGAELAGFMPRRGDFDVEWENDAEQAVADMEFVAGESEEDRQLKLRVLQIYNEKMDEREMRKRFVLNRKLYDYRKHQQEYYQKLPRDERDLVLRMRLFERFHTPAEHKQFIADLLKAKRLRKEIAKLQMYRRMGIRTLVDAEKYELDKSRRHFHKTVSIQKEAEARKAEVAAAVAAGMTTDALVDAEHCESMLYWKQYKTSERKVRKSINRGNSNVDDKGVDNEKKEGKSKPKKTGESTTSGNQKQSDAMDIDETENKYNTSSSASSEQKEEKKDDFDISSFSGYKLLSPKEVALCRSIRLIPAQYLEIKKTLIFESLANGLLESSNVNNPHRKTLLKMDIQRRGAVIDFVVQAGWISPKLGVAAKELP